MQTITERSGIRYRKVYIGVNLHVNPDGSVRPTSIIWEDGNRYKIDRVRFAVPRASTKVGGRGLMYTVMIEGKERYLFDEGGRWFVEAEVYGGIQ